MRWGLVASLLVAAAVACSPFSADGVGSPTPDADASTGTPSDGGEADREVPDAGVDGQVDGGPQPISCATVTGAVACEDFESNELRPAWNMITGEHTPAAVFGRATAVDPLRGSAGVVRVVQKTWLDHQWAEKYLVHSVQLANATSEVKLRLAVRVETLDSNQYIEIARLETAKYNVHVSLRAQGDQVAVERGLYDRDEDTALLPDASFATFTKDTAWHLVEISLVTNGGSNGWRVAFDTKTSDGPVPAPFTTEKAGELEAIAGLSFLQYVQAPIQLAVDDLVVFHDTR